MSIENLQRSRHDPARCCLIIKKVHREADETSIGNDREDGDRLKDTRPGFNISSASRNRLLQHFNSNRAA